jgi:GUN4-like/NACHT domain
MSSSPVQPPSGPERQWLKKFAQASIQWVPMGISAWFFLGFLTEQAWFNAILTLPINAITAVWAAYSKGFINRLEELYGERGQKDADSLVSGLDRLNEALSWQLSGFEKQYLRCQANKCRHYEIEGYYTSYKPRLEDLYVPLEISSNFNLERPERDLMPASLKQRFGRRRFKPEPSKDQIWDLLKTLKKGSAFRQTIIIAKGGFGKTTLLRNLTYQYATKPGATCRQYQVPRFIPFLLYLRDPWRKELHKDNASDLPALILQHHIRALPEGGDLKLPPNWVKGLLRRGEALVMLDGFDEVPDSERETVTRWIGHQIAQYPRAIFMVTSRPEGYDAFKACPGAERLATVFVKTFEPQQQQQFLERWYLYREKLARWDQPETPDIRDTAKRSAQQLFRQIQSRDELRKMAENPLMLNMIAEFHLRSPGNDLPRRRSELYKAICRMLIADRPGEKRIIMPLDEEVSTSILRQIALDMLESNTVRVEKSTLTELTQRFLAAATESPAASIGSISTEFVDKIIKVSELLVDREKSQEYEFSHRSFQDYLAACQLKELKQNGEYQVLSSLDKPWWRETILFYAELANPTSIIETACKQNTPDAIDVAYRCLQTGGNADTVPAQVQWVLQERRYEPLDALLREGKWKEADYETYRLMIRTVGKEEKQYFSPDDLRYFSCDDLKRIDHLWLKYSEGRFGFSVQKQIWLEVGGKLDFAEDIQAAIESFEKFSDRVGWRVNDQWVNYNDLTFDPSANNGTLPRLWFVVFVGSVLWSCAVLFSHQDL